MKIHYRDSVRGRVFSGTVTDHWNLVTCPSCLRDKPTATTTPATEGPKTMTTQSVPFTMTNESITLVTSTGPRTFYKNTPQYPALRQALFSEQWDRIEALLTVGGSIGAWLSKCAGTNAGVLAASFSVTETGTIQYEGVDVPTSITNRMKAMATAGEDPLPLLHFYKRLAKNPSYRSVKQLHAFMEHVGIPIEPDGTLLAYKGVTNELMDVHSETYSNAPGQVHSMPRNHVSDDPSVPCNPGFHVGSSQYAREFGARVVICRVDPEHVVSVPSDYSFQKMRVCEYAVIGFWNGETMPSTVYATDTSTSEDELDDELDDDLDEDEDRLDGLGIESFDGVEAPASTKAPTVKLSKNNRLARMSPGQLMDESIDSLRKYATHTLKIVGASKMPGGKSALVSAVLKARRKVKQPAKAKRNTKKR